MRLLRRSVWASKSLQSCIIILLANVTPSLVIGGLQALAPEIDAHVYYVKSGKEMLPVVGVVSKSKVLVLLPNKEIKAVKYRQLNWIEKKIPPVGRVTICATEGRSEGEMYASGDFISTSGSTYFTFELVADRFIPNCYVALSIEFANEPAKKYISIGKLGDLPAGELVKREVFFPNLMSEGGGSYTFEFYKDGFPIEQFYLRGVAANPRSKSLLIPWDIRMKQFLESAKQRKMTRTLRPFHRSFLEFDVLKIKSRGLKEIKITLLIKASGTIELVKGDPQLTKEEQSHLSLDVQGWQFFPSVKNGKPYDMQVAVPLKF